MVTAPAPTRIAHADELDELIAAWVAERTQQEILSHWDATDVAGCPVFNVLDLVADPHLAERGMLVELDDDELGPIRVPGIVPKLSETPGEIRYAGKPLGADNEAVFADALGRSALELARMRRAGVI